MSAIGDQARLLGRGVGFPPRIGPDGRVRWSDGEASIRESIQVILLTDPGERVMLPSFGAGLRRFLFDPNVPASHRLIEEQIEHALRRWEPRIELTAVAVAEDPHDRQRANVTIAYRLVATAAESSVDLAVRLAG